MKAIRIHGFGGPEVLELDDVLIPQPGEDELLVRIRAASVNPVDYKIRRAQSRGSIERCCRLHSAAIYPGRSKALALG